MSKTIKQIADEIGVSKQAVQKRLSREPLCTSIQPYISTVGGVKYIDVVGENIVKQAFYKNRQQPVVDNMSNASIDENTSKTTDLQPIIDVLQATIDTLQEQLSIKDNLIEKLQTEIELERLHSREQSDKLSVLADQAQRLQLAQLASSSESTLIEDTETNAKRKGLRKKFSSFFGKE